MIYAEAYAIADRIANQIRPGCELLHIAGSLRRGCKQVNDIEIVALPLQVSHRNTDLFGADVFSYHLSPVYRKTVESLGIIEMGKVGNRWLKITLPEGIKLDLFTPSKTDYYRQLAIRTGNEVYSRQYIASAWSREGWCGTDEGLRKKSECEKVGKNNWKCIKATPTLPPEWESEEAFFRWLNLSYLPPQLREM